MTGQNGATLHDSNMISMLTSEEFSQAVSEAFNPFSYVHGKFMQIHLGQIVSGLIGLFIIFKSCKFVLNLVFNSYLLTKHSVSLGNRYLHVGTALPTG